MFYSEQYATVVQIKCDVTANVQAVLYLYSRGTSHNHWKRGISESIEWFIEDQDFSPTYDLTPHPPPPLPSASCPYFSVFLCVAVRAYWQVGGGGGSIIIRQRDGPVLYKSFNTFWEIKSMKKHAPVYEFSTGGLDTRKKGSPCVQYCALHTL